MNSKWRFAAATLLLLAVKTSWATTIQVTTTTDELNNDGDCSLREAISAANSNIATDTCPAGQGGSVIDEIMIPAGTYTLSIAGINEDANQTGDLDITQSVTLTGAGAATTVIQAGMVAQVGLDRVLHVVAGLSKTITIRNLTVRNGCANNAGGVCGGGGGGVDINSTGTITIERCIVENNRGSAGGGLRTFAGGTLQTNVRSTIFRSNTANVAGGGISSQNTMLIINSVLSANTTAAGSNGAGLSVTAATTTIIDSAISANVSLGRGGGVTVQGGNNASFGTLVATNVTISDNRAEGSGGGIYINGGVIAGNNYGCSPSACNASLNNVTISGNIADYTNVFPSGDGGGVFVADTGSNPGVLTLRNSIIAQNSDNSGGASARPDCANAFGTVSSLGYNLIGNDAGCTFSSGSGDLRGTPATPINALLGAFADNSVPSGSAALHTGTLALLSGSPARDAGNPSGCLDGATPANVLAVDQRGFSRSSSRCDMGAFELVVLCGNGALDPAEECDDGNQLDGDGCSAICELEPFCGDGATDPGEACDDGNTTSGDGCDGSCQIEVVCGDAILVSGEECDDGNLLDGDGCSAICELEPICGDGILVSGEECDDGNTSDGDCCSASCTFEAAASSCDDHNTCTLIDGCDGAGLCSGAGSTCGDGTLDATCGEQCDDGNPTNGDGCSMTCVDEFCGDGSVNDGGEQCDDGNATNGDGCSSQCIDEFCGDGVVNDAGAEYCDDGNTQSGDGCNASCQIEIPVAITVDDLSRTGPATPAWSRTQIARALLDAFAAHNVPDVYGFVNATRVTNNGDQAVLQMWLDAGHPLGNHTSHHFDMRTVGVDAFIQDIDDGEPLLRAMMGDEQEAVFKMFRFPFSLEGTNLTTKAQIRAHLAENNYRIAPLTMDVFDWAFHAPFVSCVTANDPVRTEAVRVQFLDTAMRQLNWSIGASQALFGRQINHIMLMHIGQMDADLIERFLTAFEQRGVRWISLDEALTDPVYEIETGLWDGCFLQQYRELHPQMYTWMPGPPQVIGCP